MGGAVKRGRSSITINDYIRVHLPFHLWPKMNFSACWACSAVNNPDRCREPVGSAVLISCGIQARTPTPALPLSTWEGGKEVGGRGISAELFDSCCTSHVRGRRTWAGRPCYNQSFATFSTSIRYTLCTCPSAAWTPTCRVPTTSTKSLEYSTAWPDGTVA